MTWHFRLHIALSALDLRGAIADKPGATVWAAAMAVAQRTPRWLITGADEPRYIEGVATSLILRFKV